MLYIYTLFVRFDILADLILCEMLVLKVWSYQCSYENLSGLAKTQLLSIHQHPTLGMLKGVNKKFANSS
jgi:hypothetical protein